MFDGDHVVVTSSIGRCRVTSLGALAFVKQDKHKGQKSHTKSQSSLRSAQRLTRLNSVKAEKAEKEMDSGVVL